MGKAVAAVLPKYKGKLNGIALRVPTPNVSVVDLVVKVSKKCSSEDVNAAMKAAAEGPMKGIINFEEQRLSPATSCRLTTPTQLMLRLPWSWGRISSRWSCGMTTSGATPSA